MNLTIRARVTEGNDPETHEGFPTHVTVTGAQYLSGSALQEIAQASVDNMYGPASVSSYLVQLDRSAWSYAVANGTAETYRLNVVSYK